MQTSIKRYFSLGIAAALFIPLITGCSESTTAETGNAGDAGVLRIGFSGDFSGPVAPYDLPLLRGMEMAAKQINDAGGIDGITVEIMSKDNKGEQTAAIQGAQELLDDGVKVQVLTTVDGMVAVGQLVSDAGGILAGGMATTPSIINDVGERAFSVIYSDMAQAAVAAQRACDSGYRAAYLLEAPEFDYTKYLPAYFADAFAKICGGEIVGKSVYKLGQTDFGAQVTQIENAETAPDVIYSGIFLPDTGTFLKRLRTVGNTTPFIGGDGNDSKFFVDSAGSAANGVIYTAHGAATPGSELEQFYKDFEKVMGKKTESFTFEAVGRDTVYALVKAAADAGSVDPDRLLDAVLSLKNLPLVTGEISSMDAPTRYPNKKVFLVSVEGNERVFPEPIAPQYVPEPQY